MRSCGWCCFRIVATPRSDAARILAQLDAANLFITPIAQGQLAWEDAARATAPQLLILDTHLLSNMLWSQTLFGACPAWLEQQLLARHYDLHLPLDPNAVPWVDDGQRCQPQLPQRELNQHNFPVSRRR